MRIAKILRKVALALALALAPLSAYAASILPQGETQFLDDDGTPLSAGTVDFFIPSTSTPKNTWQNAGESILNTNPVQLDAGGRALIYGSGSYRMVVKDAAGVTIYDAVTTGAGGTTGASEVYWGGTSGGSANAQTITAPSFTGVDGQVIAFVAGLTNTGALTVDPTNFAATAIRKDLPGGPVALTGGEVRAGNVIMAVYDSSAGYFHLINQPDPLGGQALIGVAAAATTNVLGSVGTVVAVTGAGATINSLGTGVNKYKVVTFDGINTLTYNATSLILPGLASITTAAGDAMIVISDAASNAWVVSYTRGPGGTPFSTSTSYTFTAAQTFSGSQPIIAGYADDGASVGPIVLIDRNSTTPASNDIIGMIQWTGRDSGAAAQTYAAIFPTITDPTAASEDSTISFQTAVAGTVAGRVTIGNGTTFGAATGGDQGAGTVNATAVYDDGVLLGTIAGGGTGGTTAATARSAANLNAMGAADASFSAHKNGSDQAINTASITKLTFGTEVFDVGSKFASSTWTPPAGTVSISAGAISTATYTAAELLTLHIYKNGASYKQVTGVASSNNFVGATITIVDQANGSDTYEVYVQSAADTTWSILGTSSSTWFMGSMI